MNISVLQKAKEHDFPFVCRLIEAVFSHDELSKSTASNPNLKKSAYARLNDEKYAFVEGIHYFSLIKYFIQVLHLVCMI